jgi:hypothetical protein
MVKIGDQYCKDGQVMMKHRWMSAFLFVIPDLWMLSKGLMMINGFSGRMKAHEMTMIGIVDAEDRLQLTKSCQTDSDCDLLGHPAELFRLVVLCMSRARLMNILQQSDGCKSIVSSEFVIPHFHPRCCADDA